MSTIDNESQITKIDPNGMLQSIDDLPDQIENAWNAAVGFIIPAHYLKANKVLILGMGGSAIGGDLVASLGLNYSRVPIIVHRDYDLPNYVDSNTLVIGVSYSGKTEETLDGFVKAGDRGAKLVAISTGGDIENIAKKYRAPLLKIEYGASPRAALGYLFTSILLVLHKLDIVPIGKNEITDTVKALKEFQKNIKFNIPSSHNSAKQLAQKIVDRIPIVMGAGILSQVARRWKTQINENSKQTAVFEIFPELCHNVIVGLDFPKKLSDKIIFVILESKFDHPRNVIRQNTIMQIFKKKGIQYQIVGVEQAESPLLEMLKIILLGDYVSYYMALYNNVDPTPVQMIDFLKAKLSENK